MSKPLTPCGTMAAYRRGCRCDECRAANTARVRKQVRAKGIRPVALAPCGTKAAKNRHRRYGETCEDCAPTKRELHPCGTWQSRRRHKRNGEHCEACNTQKPALNKPAPTPKPPRTLQPCGTIAAAKRHRTREETVCEPCLEAERNRATQERRHKGIPERITTEDLIQELRFLLNAGEGEARILAATGYTGRTNALRSRLIQAGQNTLASRILNPWDLAA